MKRTLPKFTDSELLYNLESWIQIANSYYPDVVFEGKRWYADAQEFTRETAVRFNLEPYKVAAVVSALSPNNKWYRNKQDAYSVCRAFTEGLGPDDVKVCTYTSNKIKAFEILAGETEITAKSPKTHAFAMNVGLLSASHITIDKWMIRAALVHEQEGVIPTVESCTAVQYRRLEKLTAQLAKKHNLKGYELQAIVWVMIKKEWDR